MKSEAIAAVGAGATYIVEVVDRHGRVTQRSIERNNVPLQGLNHIAAVVFKGATQVNPWYLAPYEGDYTPTPGDTAATIAAAAVEITTYSLAQRAEFNEGAVADGSVDNSANKAELTFTADKTVRGVFMISSSPKGGNTGTLISVVPFSSPKTVPNGSVLRIVSGFAFASI